MNESNNLYVPPHDNVLAPFVTSTLGSSWYQPQPSFELQTALNVWQSIYEKSFKNHDDTDIADTDAYNAVHALKNTFGFQFELNK